MSEPALNILLLAPHPFFATRGTPIAVRAVLQALSEQGHHVDVLSYHEGQDVAIPNVCHWRIGRPPLVRRVPIGPSWQKAVCDLFMLGKAVRLVRRNRYDLIHAVEESAFIAGLLRRWFGIPFIYDMDSLMSAQIIEKNRALWPIARVFAWLERRTIRRSLGVLAVCQALVDEAMPYQPNGNVALLPDIPFTSTAAGELPAPLTNAQGVRLMYVGNLETYQGVDLMLDAFARIADACPTATLLVVGGSAAHIEHYRRRSGQLASTGRVCFVGPVPIDQLGTVLGYADILLSPRIKGRNTPMKIYSYLQSGKAVIATRMPTHTQVLSDDTALLVDPTPTDMAQGMRRLIEDQPRRDALGRRGRAFVEEHFIEAAFRQRLDRFYRQIAAPQLRRQGQEPGAQGQGTRQHREVLKDVEHS